MIALLNTKREIEMTDQHASTDTTLPLKAITLLPHRSPMLFVDSLIERCGDEARGTAVMPGSSIGFDSEYAFPEYFIEVVAQTIAMANGYDVRVIGEPVRNGLLVGIDRFFFKKTAPAGTLLEIAIKKTMEFSAIKIIHGEIFAGKELLVEGDIKVWEDVGETQNA